LIEMDELLRRILAEPADLAARMVYGDALVEAGDPRGELVVAQCTLAQAGVEGVEDLIDADGDLARLAGIQRRVQQLEAQLGTVWTAPLELPEQVSVQFRRGMPEAITIHKGVEAVPVLERLAKLTPIGELTLRRCGITGLERIPSWSGLRALDVTGVEMTWHLLEPMIAHGSLRRLRLSWTQITDETVDRIAQLPAFGKLRHLELTGHRDVSVAPIARLLAAHPDLVLTARKASLDDDDVATLLEAAPQVRGLDLRDNPINVATLRAMVALPRLRYLGFDPGRDVAHDKRTVGKVVAKATAPLRSLALGGSVNGHGLAAIAAVPRLADEVRAIDLVNDRPGDIGDEGNAALVAMRGLIVLVVRRESTEVGVSLMKLPTLAYFDCGYIDRRAVQQRLAAHYGTSVPTYKEREPTHRRETKQRRIEVPDKPGIDMQEIGTVLQSIKGLVAEMKVIEWIVRDPKLVADPLGVTLQKLPNKPRYITLWYWPDDADVWAARLDEIATALAAACKGKDIDRK
jgi:uncharacterized protein (TIGR02996 family)